VPDDRRVCPHGGDPGGCLICNPPNSDRDSAWSADAPSATVRCIHGGDPGACQICNQPKKRSAPTPEPDLPWRELPRTNPDPNTPADQEEARRQQSWRERHRTAPTGSDWNTYKQGAYEANAQQKHFFSPKGILGRLFGGDTCATCGQGRDSGNHV
jgi:hypothetical protein